MTAPFTARRLVMIGTAVVISVVGLSQIRFNDDIRNYKAQTLPYLPMKKLIRQTFHQQHQSQYFILTADNKAQFGA